MADYPFRIDIKAAQHDRDWQNMLSYCRDTEAIELFEGFWLFDHFVPINGRRYYHTAAFRAEEKSFPRYRHAQEWLDHVVRKRQELRARAA